MPVAPETGPLRGARVGVGCRRRRVCQDAGEGGRPGVSGFCLMLAHFSLLWLIFSIFLRILSYVAFLLRFLRVSARFFEVLGGSGEGFWEVFSRIFGDFLEVFRK